MVKKAETSLIFMALSNALFYAVFECLHFPGPITGALLHKYRPLHYRHNTRKSEKESKLSVERNWWEIYRFCWPAVILLLSAIHFDNPFQCWKFNCCFFRREFIVSSMSSTTEHWIYRRENERNFLSFSFLFGASSIFNVIVFLAVWRFGFSW